MISPLGKTGDLRYNYPHRQTTNPGLRSKRNQGFSQSGVNAMTTSDCTSIPDGFKRCPRCKIVKPFAEFHKDRSKKDGFFSRCKMCSALPPIRELRPTPPDGFKCCITCLNTYPATLEFFYRQQINADGLTGQCKGCRKTAVKRYSDAHHEEIREYGKRYHAEHRDDANEKSRLYRLAYPNRVREIKRRWYAEHREWTREKSRQYHAAHPIPIEESRDASRRYRAANPERVRENVLRRRARKRALPATFTNADWQRALGYFHGGCAYCGNSPSFFDVSPVLHREHYIPAQKGGGYTPGNIIPACQRCNHEKGSKDAHEWLVSRFGSRRATQIETRIDAYFKSIRPHDDD